MLATPLMTLPVRRYPYEAEFTAWRWLVLCSGVKGEAYFPKKGRRRMLLRIKRDGAGFGEWEWRPQYGNSGRDRMGVDGTMVSRGLRDEVEGKEGQGVRFNLCRVDGVTPYNGLSVETAGYAREMILIRRKELGVKLQLGM